VSKESSIKIITTKQAGSSAGQCQCSGLELTSVP